MNDEDSRLAMEGICFAADQVKVAFEETAYEYRRPSAVYRPALSIDGNKWCALYGENLQDGVAGFGDCPSAAMYDFDANWLKSLDLPT